MSIRSTCTMDARAIVGGAGSGSGDAASSLSERGSLLTEQPQSVAFPASLVGSTITAPSATIKAGKADAYIREGAIWALLGLRGITPRRQDSFAAGHFVQAR